MVSSVLQTTIKLHINFMPIQGIILTEIQNTFTHDDEFFKCHFPKTKRRRVKLHIHHINVEH